MVPPWECNARAQGKSSTADGKAAGVGYALVFHDSRGLGGFATFDVASAESSCMSGHGFGEVFLRLELRIGNACPPR
jgi:hypothetical protein